MKYVVTKYRNDKATIHICPSLQVALKLMAVMEKLDLDTNMPPASYEIERGTKDYIEMLEEQEIWESNKEAIYHEDV